MKDTNFRDYIGSTLIITEMQGEPQYTGKSGIITSVDDADQIHGTWGGCAIIPETDLFIIIKTADGKSEYLAF